MPTQDNTQVWLALIAVIPVTIASITTALLAWDARGTTRTLVKVANDTHTLVNSAMGTQLRLTATVTRRLAEMTKNDPIEGPLNEQAAKLAEDLLAGHEAKQKIVDRQINANRDRQVPDLG